MIILHALLCAACIGSAQAQDLVYEPINPSFGGDSFNSAHLLAIANAQNDYEDPDVTGSESDVDRFVRSLQSRLLSSLSSQVANAIFGEDAAESGKIVFGDQTIEFQRTLEGIELKITDADGNVTVVTVPTLVTESMSQSLAAEQAAATNQMESALGEPLGLDDSDFLEPLGAVQ